MQLQLLDASERPGASAPQTGLPPASPRALIGGLQPTLALMQYRKIRRTQSGRVGLRHEQGDASVVWFLALAPALVWALWASLVRQGDVSTEKALSIVAVSAAVSVVLGAVGPLAR